MSQQSVTIAPSLNVTVADYPSMCAFWQKLEHPLAIDLYLENPTIQAIFDRIHKLDETDLSPQAVVPYSPIGYVYAAWNPLFGGLIKIGATMRQNPYLRVVELSTSGVPEPFQLIASIPSKDPFALEREIHLHFDSVRKYGRKKEFFTVSRDQIGNYFHMKSIQESTKIREVGLSNQNPPIKRKIKRKCRGKPSSYERRTTYMKKIDRFVQQKTDAADPENFVSTQEILEALLRFEGENHITNKNWLSQAISQRLFSKFPHLIQARVDKIRGYKGLMLR